MFSDTENEGMNDRSKYNKRFTTTEFAEFF